ncbi:bifunctional diguanylate cyclase/phosphodiesterase [Marinobacter sp. 2_MG-2023]|uniref:bifunctional diguanylate cyclase/phosphodiesterase n=1 Tax=Marinobacter sp. 2_MG-2023 TaxID=3062679 RepID=UPI0026E1CA1E|nr:bifunctional diguanylate cyclase/phosphodiesterase [Marinobacter sp. 2_MG-2023]MDO6440538.1 EAL domain-containing protein [Marinobacter sp. 2_MG-2023]
MTNRQAATRDSVHQLFDAVDAISVQGYDEERRVVYWNVGSELLYGYTKEEAIGRKLEELIIPGSMREEIIAAHKEWVDKGVEIPASEIILRDKNDRDVNVFSSHVMFFDASGECEMYCIDIDLADVKKAKAQATLRENLLKAVFSATPDLFFLMSEEGVVINFHAGDSKKLYAMPNNIIGNNLSDLLPDKIKENLSVNTKKAIDYGDVVSFEYDLEFPSGVSYFEARISHLKDNKQILIIVRDITEQHNSAELIRKQAYFDALTSLPNRFLCLDRLSQMIRDMERTSEKFAVLFLDIDDFKKVNDSLGHEVGDKLLIEAANRLNQAVRKSDTVGRLGGDEFIILLRSLTDYAETVTVVENLLKIFREPFGIDGRELVLTISIGIAVYPDNGVSANDLLRNADTAMYQAKASGRNTHSFFTKDMNDMVLRRLEVEDQLHGALERNEFEVFYQPKFDLKNKSIIGAEALLRWHSPKLGNVGPDEFIPIAEHTGLIVPIGKYVVAQSIKFLVEWERVSQRNYTMAVNLSPRQFRDEELIGFVKNSLDSAGVSPERLEFEITEGVLMIGKSYVDDALHRLHDLGVQLSMDDFGTGYSSLSYLRQYSFDILKIDRSFINGITYKSEDRSLVTATIAMAHSLGLCVVAEGVETREQLDLLEELGCDIAQGFYLSKPVRPGELIDFQYTKDQ